MSQKVAEKHEPKSALIKDAAFKWDDPLDLDGELTEEERMVRDTARDYAQEKLFPRVLAAYRDERYDPAIMREMGALGLSADRASFEGRFAAAFRMAVKIRCDEEIAERCWASIHGRFGRGRSKVVVLDRLGHQLARLGTVIIAQLHDRPRLRHDGDQAIIDRFRRNRLG
jgi:Acyl-CoA dehydrogenase, N-terminal domain